MKKYLVCLIALLITFIATSQEKKQVAKIKIRLPIKYSGVGLQYAYPFPLLTAKFGVSEHSAVQVIANPFYIGNYGLSYYAGRYIYKVPEYASDFNKDGKYSGYPYGFGGLGILLSSFDGSSEAFFSYSFGAGYEILFNKKFGLAGELQYGVFSFSNGGAILIPSFGLSGHYYFHKSANGKASNPYANSMPHSRLSDASEDENDANVKDAKKESTEKDDDGDEPVDDEKRDTTTRMRVDHKTKFFFSADFGGCTNKTTVAGYSDNGHGLTWAVSGNWCYKLTQDSAKKVLLTYGVELRNYNATFSFSDDFNETGYNNYHFWYAGVPVSLVYIDNKIRKSGLYVQAQLTPAYRVAILNVIGDQGKKTSVREDNAYSSIIICGGLSAGIILKFNNNPLLAGVFINRSLTNASAIGDIKENLLSYGFRLAYYIK